MGALLVSKKVTNKNQNKMQNSIKEIVLILDDTNEVITEDSTLVVSVEGVTNGQTFMDLCLGEYSQGFSLLNWETCISGCFMFEPEIRDGKMYINNVHVYGFCRETKTKHEIKGVSKPIFPTYLNKSGAPYDAALERANKFYGFIDEITRPRPVLEPVEPVEPVYSTDIFLKDAKEYIHNGYELFQFDKEGKKLLFLFLNGLKTKYKDLVRSKEMLVELYQDGNYDEFTKSEAVINEDGTIEYTFKRGAESISFVMDTNKMEVIL